MIKSKWSLAVAGLLCICAGAVAQESFPSHPIRLLVGFTPGGSTDIGARVMAQRLGAAVGQPVVVENRPGAGGLAAALGVAGSSPDGHTLLWGHIAQVVLTAVFKQDPNFDPLRDLTPVAATVKVDSLLVVPAASGITTFKQFAALLQDKSKNKFYGTQGAGTPGHLMNAWVAAKVDATNTVAVHYKGATNSEADFLSGQITYRFDTVTTLKRLGGKLNCLATLTEKRLADAPDCPTFAEVGMPLDVDWTLWNSVHAPARTPRPLIDRLYAVVSRILADQEFAKATEKFGITPLLGYTPEKTYALQEQQIRDWSEAVKRMGITAAE
jgi:tripartite-type tricarboxylate transporter receptor subunit TctC